MFCCLLFFFLDFLCFSFLNKWLIYLSLTYFVAILFSNFKTKSIILLFLCLLIQDCFINGRFGLATTYLLPMFLFTPKICKTFRFAGIVFPYVFLILAILIDAFFIKKWILGLNIYWHSTLLKILINIIVEYLILLGMWGNRSLLYFK